MIVIGYQGIGKSTLCNKQTERCIDLESSNFFIDGVRDKNWYVIYCKIAYNLSQQGYTVFTSSHKEVRDEFKRYVENDDIYVCYPTVEIQNQWLKRLADRWEVTRSDKDMKAYLNAKETYINNISDLAHERKFKHIIINNINYNLSEIIKIAKGGLINEV